MGERFIGQNGEDHRNGDAVVAAKRRLVRPDPFAVSADIEPIARHVLGAVLGLGADHVDMALQNDGRGVLVALRAVLPDDKVVARFLTVLEAKLLGKADAQVADLLRISTAVRDGAELFKIVEDPFGLETGSAVGVRSRSPCLIIPCGPSRITRSSFSFPGW